MSLELVIGADLSKAIKGIADFNNAVGTIPGHLKGIQGVANQAFDSILKKIEELPPTMQDATRALILAGKAFEDFDAGVASIEDINKAIEVLRKSVEKLGEEEGAEDLRKSFKELQSISDSLSSGVKNKVNPQLNQLEKAIKNTRSASNAFNDVFSNVPALLSGAEKPAEALAGQLEVLIKGIANARESGESFGSILGHLVTGFFTLEGILAVGTKLFESFVEELFNSKEAAEEAAIGLETYKQKLEEIQDSIETLKRGLNFRQELNSLQFKLNQGIAEPGSLKDLQNKKAFDQFDISEKIRLNNVALSETDKKLTKINDEFLKGQKLVDGLRGELKKMLESTGEAGKELINKNPIAKILALPDITKAPKVLIDKLDDQQKAFLEGFIETNNTLIKLDKDRTEITNENAKLRIQAGLSELENTAAINKKLQDLAKQSNEKILSQGKAILAELKAINFVIPVELGLTGLETDGEAIKKIKALLEFLALRGGRLGSFQARIPLDIDIPQTKANFEEKLNNPQLIFGGKEIFKLKVSLAIDEDLKKQLDSQNAKLTAVAQSIGANIATALGEGFASAVSGGGIKGFFSELFAAVGAGLKQLGIAIIGISPLIQSLKIALKTLSPQGILLAGIGLVAAGSIIQKAASKFAAGGLVFGPTLGLVGEGSGTSRSNPEVIAPLDKLKNFIQPNVGNVNIAGQFKISGNDLLLAIARNQNSQLRTT